MESRKIQFRGTQVIRVFSSYWRFDAAFSTLTAEPGGWGLSFYPEIPLQYTSSFCKTFSVRYIRTVCMYECILMYQVSKTWEILLLLLKNTCYDCYFTLHRVWNIDLHNAKNSISRPLDFKIFWGGMPDPPRGSRLRRSYLIAPLNRDLQIGLRVRDWVRVRLFNSSFQASHYHTTYPFHPTSYSLYLKPTCRRRAHSIKS